MSKTETTSGSDASRGTSEQPAGLALVNKITAAAPTMTPKMRRVAEFVHQEYRRAAFMTTREIAAEAGVSLATVVRLPAALGYADFEELRQSIEDRLNFDLSAVDRLQIMSAESPTGAGLLQRAIHSETEELNRLATTFDAESFERFVSRIAMSRSTMVIGFRWVAPFAEYLRYSLNKIKPGVRGYTDEDSKLYDEITLLGADDIIVVIGFARYPRALISVLQYASSRGIPIVGITDSPLSPVGPFCSTVLQVRSQLLDFAGTLGAPGALISCVVSAVGLQRGDEAYTRLSMFEEAAGAAHLYVDAPPAHRTPRERNP